MNSSFVGMSFLQKSFTSGVVHLRVTLHVAANGGVSWTCAQVPWKASLPRVLSVSKHVASLLGSTLMEVVRLDLMIPDAYLVRRCRWAHLNIRRGLLERLSSVA